MNVIKYAIVFAILTSSSLAMAQGASDVLRDAVFSEIEKRIIGEHFGIDVKDVMQNGAMPEWAVKSDERDEDDLEEDDEDKRDKKDKVRKDKGKKDKDHKNKGKSKGLPPGLAKRESLPPGLQKQLDEKGRLPHGLAKRDLPDDLAAKLPKRPDDQSVVVVDADVVLIDKATGVILDVLKDVVRGKSAPVQNPDGTLSSPGSQTQNGAGPGVIDTLLKNIFGGQ